MNVIQLTEDYLTACKRVLRSQTDAKSAHLSEAIARGCGYGSNISLMQAIRTGARDRYRVFDEVSFRHRLAEFGATDPAECELPELDRSSRYVKPLFEATDLQIDELHPMRARFRLKGIATLIGIDLHLDRSNFRFERSHAIHTPSQAGPYWPSRDFDDDAAYAMHRAIDSIVDYYRDAIRDGHRPNERWLVKAAD